MKKLFLSVLLVVMGVGVATAQRVHYDWDVWNGRAGYFNIGYVNQKLGANFVWKDAGFAQSDWGVSITNGRTYYLHKRPIADMVKIGLDWSWVDFNIAKYDVGALNYIIPSEGLGVVPSVNALQAELGMQFGPSATINPIDDLKISAYLRVSPSYSVLYQPDIEKFCGNYATFVNLGAAFAWKLMSVGIEYRRAKCGYKEIGGEGYLSTYGDVDFKTKGTRVYLSFRF